MPNSPRAGISCYNNVHDQPSYHPNTHEGSPEVRRKETQRASATDAINAHTVAIPQKRNMFNINDAARPDRAANPPSAEDDTLRQALPLPQAPHRPSASAPPYSANLSHILTTMMF